MAAERPTFHESWYRVASLRPRLRSTVESSRQEYRGKTWHVLRDLATNKFFRVDESDYRLLGLLDGERTFGEAWSLTCEQIGDQAPTQGEAITLLGQLYSSNLLDADLPGDAAGMLRRRNKRVNREVRQYLKSLLFAKIPLFDPDRLLDRALPFASWCFSPMGVVLWAVLLWFGLGAVAGRWGELWSQSSGVLAPDNLFLLYVASVFTKLAHELGHGIACKRFGRQPASLGGGGGGEIHTFGVMLLVFIPMPYVDATSVWGMRSKWKRAAVGAAGMYVEIAIACVAAILWARSPAGTALNALAYNVMFTAGVSTILFNANPLIRFDGYFILSDLLEAPNLAQRATEKLHYLVKRYAYGVKRPLNPTTQRAPSVGLVTYGLSALVYRIWLSVSILLFVADKLFFIGAAMAVASLVAWVIVPWSKFAHYLAASPELYKTRRRAVLATVLPLAAVFAFLGGVPVREHARAEGIVESAQRMDVHAATDGFMTRTAPSGSEVEPGTPFVVMENPELVAKVRRVRAQLSLLETKRRIAMLEEPARAQALAQQIAAVREEAAHAEWELSQLSILPPFPGVWLCGDHDRVHGRYVKRGDLLGTVAGVGEMQLRVVADQFVGPHLVRRIEEGQDVSLRVKGDPGSQSRGVVTRILRGGQRELPSDALGYSGGGALPVAADARTAREAAEPFFEVRMRLDPAGLAPMFSGQRVVARFELPPSPLLAQGWRMARQLLQQRFHI